MAWVSIGEAVTRLGVSEVTIRRRLRKGDLHGEKQSTPQGFVWLVEVPDEEVGESSNESAGNGGGSPELVAALRDTIQRQDEVVAQLNHQLETREREVGELHILLQRVQQAALPAPKEDRPWWRFWER